MRVISNNLANVATTGFGYGGDKAGHRSAGGVLSVAE